MRRLGVVHAFLVLLFGPAHAPAHAFGNLILIDSPPAQDYSLSVGPGIAGYQRYPGARGLKVIPVPGVDLYFPNGAFASTDNGIGWNFAKREDLQFGDSVPADLRAQGQVVS